MQKKTPFYQLLTAALFICLVLSFAVTYVTNLCLDNDKALDERCYDGSVVAGDGLTDRFNRSFYQNSASLDFVRRFEYRLFGIVNHSNVIVGKNGFLFEVEDKENGYNYLKDYLGMHTFTDGESAAILAELQRREQRYNERGCQYLLVILPNAQSVYSEYMPHYLGAISGNTRLAVLDRYLQANGFDNYINMTDVLRDFKDHSLPLYNNTENSLNALGHYYPYIMLCASFSDNAYDYESLISRGSLDFFQHYTVGRSLAKEAGLENVLLNHTISLSNDVRVDYRLLFNSGYVAKTVRNNYGGIAASSVSSLLLQFSSNRDRLLAETFYSNTFDFVTYQPDHEDNTMVFERADPSVVIQFIYENELSQLLSGQGT
ncbi:MAG: hypothetical protein E7644_06425 [Ruminococcaceae bacterium]|nr:hypothetical protein [Oscillospiraceae bacterium]